MELSSAISGFLGALIGSLASIATLLIKERYQYKREKDQYRREMKKLAIGMAMEDYKFRITNESEKVRPAAAPILLAYHAKMIELLNDDRLNPENADELLKVQMEMHKALYKNYPT